ncbi:MAG: type II secretion system protein GspC [Steroidobacteraceae bacterium]
MSPTQWAQLGNRRAPQLLAGLAVLGIAWQAAKLTWLVLSPGVTVNQSVPVVPTQASASNQVSPQQIADAHLFGVASADPGITDPNNLPKSQMNLILAGTMALEDPEAGYAIIGTTAANAKFYRVGATIDGGVHLHSVYTDRVIIDRSGTLETIVLPRGLPSNFIAPPVRSTSDNVVNNLRRIVSNNPSALGELLRAQPVFSNGVQKGYRVYPGRDRQQFARLGLQPGDLVTSINGSSLDDVNRGAEILNTLTASTTAQVMVERNGTSQAITLDMAQLSLPDSTTSDSSSSGGDIEPNNADFASSPNANRGLRGPNPVTDPASTQ